jgi:hypothetical protein
MIMKFCDHDDSRLCPEREQQTWIAGRMGFKL